VSFLNHTFHLHSEANREHEDLQLLMTLYRPDIPSKQTAAHGGVVSPARSMTTTSSTINELQRLSLSRPPSLMTPATNNLTSSPSRACGTPNYAMQPTYGMVPVMYSNLPLGPPPNVFDHMLPRSHSTMVSTGNYSLVAPMYPQQPSMVNQDYLIPRHLTSPRSDFRRLHAIRIARAPSSHQVSGQHNVVDVNRIQEGIDVRTTVSIGSIVFHGVCHAKQL
jgi:hypothetical protein